MHHAIGEESKGRKIFPVKLVKCPFLSLLETSFLLGVILYQVAQAGINANAPPYLILLAPVVRHIAQCMIDTPRYHETKIVLGECCTDSIRIVRVYVMFVSQIFGVVTISFLNSTVDNR